MKKLFIFLTCIVCSALSAQSICIDPGHGGGDPGAVGWGLEEKNINLDVSQRLQRLMEQSGWKVYLVRGNDKTVSLASRTNYANSLKVDRFVSIHCNAFNKTASGTETFAYTEGSSTSFAMRNSVHPRMVRAMGTVDRGTKTANFYVIKHTNMPAILCELAFIDEKNDSAKLGDSYYRQKVAEAIQSGVASSLVAFDAEIKNASEYIAPKWSMDGNTLLITTPGYNGMSLLDVRTEEITSISDENSYNAKWMSDSEIILANTMKMVTTDGQVINGIATRESVFCKVEDNQLLISNNGNEHVITEEQDIIFNAVISPNNDLVVYECLNSGLHVATIEGVKLYALGKGNNPCWTADGQKIAFDNAIDNGHEITGSDICLFDLTAATRTNIKSDSLIPQRPSISPDGQKIAFDSKGKIFIADIEQNSLQNIQALTK